LFISEINSPLKITNKSTTIVLQGTGGNGYSQPSESVSLRLNFLCNSVDTAM